MSHVHGVSIRFRGQSPQSAVLGAILASVALGVTASMAATHSPAPHSGAAVRLPVKIAGQDLGLEALIVSPAGDGPFPVALITHGSPRDPSRRRKMGPLAFRPLANEFAERGYVAAVVMRRGYGRSGGRWAEGYGGCETGDYERAGYASAEDLHAAIAALSRDTRVDADRVLLIGKSAGGFGALATAARYRRGIRGVINLAGGRGALKDRPVCRRERLIEAFAAYGARSTTATLWIYARNDKLFAPRTAQRFFDAFTAAGGRAEFLQLGVLRPQGHRLQSRAGIDMWLPRADAFLQRIGLPHGVSAQDS